MSLQRSNPESIHAPGPYAHVVKAGDTLYISGQVPVNAKGELVGPGDGAAQARQVFENLRECLASYGVGMDRIAKLTILVVGREHLNDVREVRDTYFANQEYPASTLALVAGLVDPHWFVEVEAVALLS